jgi:hypothetical protein
MTTFYCNGDSFVFGMEIFGHGNREERNKELSFTKHVADELGCDTYINSAYNGATNDFIFKTTIADLIELEKTMIDPKDTFVLIAWTSLIRIELDARGFYGANPFSADIDQDLQQHTEAPEAMDRGVAFISPFLEVLITKDNKEQVDLSNYVLPWLTRFIWTDPVLILAQQARMAAMEAFLKGRGYRYVFVATCGDYTFPLLEDSNHYFWPEEKTMHDFCLKHFPNHQRQDQHFDEVPHAAFGKLLVDYITKNQLY